MLQSPVKIGASPSSSTSSNDIAHAAPASGTRQVQELRLESIVPNVYQPRKSFDAGSLERLAESIRAAGVMQPILVRPRRTSVGEEPRDSTSSYELVAGERRWRAAAIAGLAIIPAIVQNLSDEQSAEWALIENLQRDDLGPLERATALRTLAEKFGLTHAQVAERIGLDRSSVTNLIRLTELEPEIAALLDQRRLTLGHGKALLSIPPGPARVELARRASEEEWSVRKLERFAAANSSLNHDSKIDRVAEMDQAATPKEVGVKDLESQLTQFFGTKVELSVTGRAQQGRLIISFYGLDHFDSLMAKVGFRPR